MTNSDLSDLRDEVGTVVDDLKSYVTTILNDLEAHYEALYDVHLGGRSKRELLTQIVHRILEEF